MGNDLRWIDEAVFNFFYELLSDANWIADSITEARFSHEGLKDRNFHLHAMRDAHGAHTGVRTGKLKARLQRAFDARRFQYPAELRRSWPDVVG